MEYILRVAKREFEKIGELWSELNSLSSVIGSVEEDL
jgi:hypothetical protein